MIFYVLRGGIAWLLLPKDFPPKGTVYDWFYQWRDDGTFERMNHILVMANRERASWDASPTSAVIDSQSVKTTETGGPRRSVKGKKVCGRNRQTMIDTDGRGLVLLPQPACVQDRDGAGPLLRLSRLTFPFVARAFADAGYVGDRPQNATVIDVEIVWKL